MSSSMSLSIHLTPQEVEVILPVQDLYINLSYSHLNKVRKNGVVYEITSEIEEIFASIQKQILNQLDIKKEITKQDEIKASITVFHENINILNFRFYALNEISFSGGKREDILLILRVFKLNEVNYENLEAFILSCKEKEKFDKCLNEPKNNNLKIKL